jgi:hypothetical protein
MRALLSIAVVATLLLAQALAGTYKGKWSGASGSDGDFHLTLGPDGKGGVKADVMFTLGGQEVKCTVVRIKIEGEKIVDLAYQFSLGDIKLESAITGEKKGSAFEGTYKTKAVADSSAVDEGTWKASQ